ncbi:hypothetical protein [Phormidesmis sp. 146-33]
MNKSTSTVAALYQQLLKHSNRVFLQRVCPDGEGMWSSEADPAIVRSIRRKGQFSEEFVLETLRAIDHLGQNPHFSIVLLDLGGKRTAENAEILQRSDFLILLSSNLQEISHWQQFAHCENCETIAFLESRLHKIDAVLNQTVCSHINFNVNSMRVFSLRCSRLLPPNPPILGDFQRGILVQSPSLVGDLGGVPGSKSEAKRSSN